MKYSFIYKLDGMNERGLALVDLIRLWGPRLGLAESESSPDFLIAVGGDGTMVQGLKESCARGIPVMGVNAGNLGFLTEYTVQNLVEGLAQIASSEAKVEERGLLSLKVEGKEHLAANEIAFAPKYGDAILDHGFYINDIFSGKHRANALIVATPTGSTAYALSVGGAILEPTVPVFQIVSVAPMAMSARPVIVSDTSRIKVVLFSKAGMEFIITADGQRVLEGVGSGTPLSFHLAQSSCKAKMFHMKNWNFFTTLTEKLHWNSVGS